MLVPAGNGPSVTVEPSWRHDEKLLLYEMVMNTSYCAAGTRFGAPKKIRCMAYMDGRDGKGPRDAGFSCACFPFFFFFF